jgi:zinc protease
MRHQSLRETAEVAFWQAVYRDYPYAHPPGGTEESLAALTREQVVAFYQHYYRARNAVVAIVGNIERAQAAVIAEAVVKQLPTGQAAPALPPVPALDAARTVRQAFPASQTHLLLGQPGMARGDPLYFPLYVGNHILGGSGLVSQLFEEVREKRGLAYNVYSTFIPMARQGPFMAGLQTRNVQAEQARQVLHDTLSHFVEQGPTPEDFALAKQHLLGSFPLQLDSNQKIVDTLAIIGFYDLPLDYLARFPERVEAVDAAAVHAALQARLHPQRLITVLVGGAVEASETAPKPSE